LPKPPVLFVMKDAVIAQPESRIA